MMSSCLQGQGLTQSDPTQSPHLFIHEGANKARRAELFPAGPSRERICPGPSLTLPQPEGASDPALG